MNKKLKNVLSVVLFSFLIGWAAFTGSIQFGVAQTGVITVISSDTTWTKANSPYTFTGPVLVSQGATLTIEAGVTVNATSIVVNGTLVAKGNTNEKICFNYSIIEFTESSTNWTEQTDSGSIIENAYCSHSWININGASPKIMNCNDVEFLTANESSSIISQSTLLEVILQGGAPLISENTISGGLEIIGGSPVISNNTIYGGIRASTGLSVEVSDILKNAPKITNNTITSFGDFEGGVINLDGCIPVISNNTIISLNVHNASRRGQNERDIIYGIYYDRNLLVAWTGDDARDAYISDNIISGCTTAGISLMSGRAIVERNLITNCTDGIDIVNGPNVIVRNNTISNVAAGIRFKFGSLPSITFNNIQNGIYLDDVANSDVNATYNWWGSTDTEAINASIHDSKFGFDLGTVTFVPFLNESNPNAYPNPSLIPNFSLPTQPSTPKEGSVPDFITWGIVTTLIVAIAVAATFFVIKRKNKRHNP